MKVIKAYDHIDIFLSRIEECSKALLTRKDDFGLQKIILFGSCARATCTPRSDIDLFLVVTKSPREVEGVIFSEMFDIMVRDFPLADVHACSLERWNDLTDYATPFDDFLNAIRREGIVLWEGLSLSLRYVL